MVFQVHRPFAAATLVALAVAFARAASAQAEFEPVAKDDAQRALVENIVAVQARYGAFSPELVAPFAELAELYQDGGDYDLAAAANDRALHLVRVNEGLHTLDQLPLLEQSIDNAQAMGDVETAGALQQELQILIWRNPNDVRTVPVLRNFGDRQISEIERLRAGELPPPVRLGGGDSPSEPFLGNRDARARWMALGARRYYAGAIRVLLEHQDYTSDDLADLEMQLVRINYLYLSGPPYRVAAAPGYDSGRRSLLRQVSYQVAKDEPLIERVNALVRVADWDLLYTENSRAIPTYEQAYEVLRKNGVPGEDIDAIFSPPVPVVLPTFLANPLETREAGSTAYIDVVFEIRKYGGAENVRVVDASPTATRNDETELVRLIKASDFRPRVTNGELRKSAVTLRYYLH